MNRHIPPPVARLIDALADLPSIGPRQATRLAFYLIGRGPGFAHAFATAFDELSKIKICERCFFIHQNPGALCDICKDPKRDQRTILIVEKETDLLSIENTKRFTGRYSIIGPIPKTGILEEWQKLRLQNLKAFIVKELGGQADEIIIGFNLTSAGDFNAGMLVGELAPLAKKISRLGRGLPTGGEIEFADDETLGSSLERRN